MNLRKYQTDAVKSVFDFFAKHHEQNYNPVIVIPTGGGKSLIQAEIINRIISVAPWFRIGLVTHQKELIKQNYDEFNSYTNDKYINITGIYSAGHKRRDFDKQILFCGVQSVYNKLYNLIGKFDLIIVDEAHTIPKKAGKIYRQFIQELYQLNSKTKIIGLTATPYRLDSGLLTTPPDNLFHTIVYEAKIKDLIKKGFLCELKSKLTDNEYDTSAVKHKGKDFDINSLSTFFDVDTIVQKTCAELKNYIEKYNRKKILVFSININHAEHITAELNKIGLSANCVHSKNKNSDQILSDYKNDKFNILVNVDQLTTGFNEKRIDCIAMLRPTESTGLYVQMIGRGFRIHPQKDFCLVLDFAGNIKKHGPIDKIKIKDKNKGAGKTPLKKCPECSSPVIFSKLKCPECGFNFPKPELNERTINHLIKPDTNADILYKKKEPKTFDVKDVAFIRHKKTGRPDSIKVVYTVESIPFYINEFLCPEHGGYATRKFEQWIEKFLPDKQIFIDTNSFLKYIVSDESGYKKPDRIVVDVNDKYPKILRYE